MKLDLGLILFKLGQYILVILSGYLMVCGIPVALSRLQVHNLNRHKTKKEYEDEIYKLEPNMEEEE